MKQKIVISVQMPSKCCRSKAMKIAVKADGVTKVEVKGEEKNQLEVIGNEVDSVRLTRKLRKKLGFASILTVEEEKEKEKEEKEKEELQQLFMNSSFPPRYVICEEPYQSVCSIV